MVGGAARETDGTAEAGSFMYGLSCFVLLRDFIVIFCGIVVWIAVGFVCECACR